MSFVTASETMTRIARDPHICGGSPCVKGTRIPVSVILSHLAAGESLDELLGGFQGLTREDVYACLAYAAMSLSDQQATP